MVAANDGYDYTVKIDADGQHKPEEITKLLNPLINDEADMTAGSRYLTLDENHNSAVREGGIVFSSTLVSSFWKMKITDITSGMRAWNRKAIQTLLPTYMERGVVEDSVFWVIETFLASKKRLRLKEVPIEVLPRKYGNSKSFSLDKMLLYPLRLIITLIQETRG